MNTRAERNFSSNFNKQVKGVHPIIFVSNFFPNSHLIVCIQLQQLFWNSCWLCIHFWIKWELGKIFNFFLIVGEDNFGKKIPLFWLDFLWVSLYFRKFPVYAVWLGGFLTFDYNDVFKYACCSFTDFFGWSLQLIKRMRFCQFPWQTFFFLWREIQNGSSC